MDNIRCGYSKKKKKRSTLFTEIIIELDLEGYATNLDSVFDVIGMEGGAAVTIDWGDGAALETVVVNSQHNNIYTPSWNEREFCSGIIIGHDYTGKTGTRFTVRLTSTDAIRAVKCDAYNSEKKYEELLIGNQTYWAPEYENYSEIHGYANYDDFWTSRVVGVIKYESNTIQIMDDVISHAMLEYIDSPMDNSVVPNAFTYRFAFSYNKSTNTRLHARFLGDLSKVRTIEGIMCMWRTFNGTLPVGMFAVPMDIVNSTREAFMYMEEYQGPMRYPDISGNEKLFHSEQMYYYCGGMTGSYLDYVNQKSREWWSNAGRAGLDVDFIGYYAFCKCESLFDYNAIPDADELYNQTWTCPDE